MNKIVFAVAALFATASFANTEAKKEETKVEVKADKAEVKADKAEVKADKAEVKTAEATEAKKEEEKK